MAQAICSIDGCDKTAAGRGWCPAHWYRWSKHGDPLGGGPSKARAVDHPDGTRSCSKCGERKPLVEFHKAETAALGHRPDCKACRTALVRDWYEENRERQQRREQRRRIENGEEIRARERLRYERDYEKRRLIHDVATARRRARIAGVRFDRGVTKRNLRSQYGDLCFYCAVSMSFERHRKGDPWPPNLATLDHVLAIALGGTHTWDNVVLACWLCNCSKRHAPVDEWQQRKAGSA